MLTIKLKLSDFENVIFYFTLIQLNECAYNDYGANFMKSKLTYLVQVVSYSFIAINLILIL